MSPEDNFERWEVREVGVPRLGEFEPGPRRPHPLLLTLFLLAYGPGLGSATFFIARDQLFGQPNVGDYLLVGLYLVAYLLIPFPILFYWLYNAHRFTFTDTGLRVLTPFGRRFVPWGEIERASLRIRSAEGAIFHRLDLFVGRRQRLGIPLSDYLRGATLLAAIRPRLPVPLEEPDSHVEARLEDSPDR